MICVNCSEVSLCGFCLQPQKGSDEVVPGTSVFPSREPGVSGDFWGSQEGGPAPGDHHFAQRASWYVQARGHGPAHPHSCAALSQCSLSSTLPGGMGVGGWKVGSPPPSIPGCLGSPTSKSPASGTFCSSEASRSAQPPPKGGGGKRGCGAGGEAAEALAWKTGRCTKFPENGALSSNVH